ncbi:hypothetical protein EVJ32_04755 [Exiguobacterium sp. SH5S4]|uniref:toprim domain-containing protein n=1 Tax=Exiguobacterium sp. SH5S4 TaxID=2510961 RepID=UPI001038888E|nr:toprim domain-containing protein [Exiguobacterium sp. SH5S4]TCI26687.1 hypothetical protein EVJ32_04755 [Exiguobacterium sp. SH5S4]
MDYRSVKQYIFDNELIENVLEGLECEHIRPEQGGQLFVARLPERFGSKNRRAVQIRNVVGLYANVRNRNLKGDIFQLVAALRFDDWDGSSEGLSSAIRWLSERFGIVDGIEMSDKRVKNDWLKQLGSSRKIHENDKLPLHIMNQYVMKPNKWWIDEGISYKTQVEFDVGFDLESRRIIFPVHNEQGDLIGVKGRLVHYEREEDKQFKYLYLHACNKSIEWFNLHRALPFIEEKRRVIIFEGAKSCMSAWSSGIKYTVSIEGDSVTDAQVKKLQKLPLDTEFIVAMDKDKDEEYVRGIAAQLGMRKISYVMDDNGLLGKPEDKTSPMDKGWDVLRTLLKERKTYRKSITSKGA